MVCITAPRGRRLVESGLAGLAGLASVGFVLATPVRGTAISAGPEGTVTQTLSGSPLMLMLVITQAIAAVLLLIGAVAVLRGNASRAKVLILAGAVAGLFPVPVTSALALAAYLLIRSSER
jgi:hypothetical protein